MSVPDPQRTWRWHHELMSATFRALLPNARNQSVPDVVLIFDVTGQLPHKYFFLVQDTCNENGYKDGK